MRMLDTWPATVGRSLLLGAAAGGSGIVVVMIGASMLGGGSPGLLVVVTLGSIYFFVVAFVLWFLGLVVFGLVPWWILHRLKLRTKRAAAITGFALPVGLGVLVNNGQPNLFIGALGVIGVIVAETIWFSAYRRGAGAPRPERVAMVF